MPSYPYFSPYGQATSPYMVYPNNAYTPVIPQQPYYPNYLQQNMKAPEPPRPKMTITWIKSEKDVDDEYVEPNSAAAFWNENEPVIYVKKADVTGKSSVTAYDLVERKPQEEEKEEPKQEYVTSSDFKSLVGAVNNINDNFSKEMRSFANLIETMRNDVDAIKSDMYGIAGKKKAIRKTEGEEDA